MALIQNRLKPSGVIVGLSILVGIASVSPQYAAIVGGFVVAGLLWVVRIENVMYLVFLLQFVDDSPIIVGSAKIRFYMVIFLIAFIRLLFSRQLKLNMSFNYKFIWIWFLCFFPSYQIGMSFHVGYMGVVLGTLFLIIMSQTVTGFLVNKGESYIDKMVQATILGTIITALSGFVQVAISPVLHMPFQSVGGLIRPYGYMKETDWYGTVCAMGVLLLLWLILNKRYDLLSKFKTNASLLICILGTILSQSRAAWLGLLIASLYVIFRAIRTNGNQKAIRRILKTSLAVVVSLIFLVLIVVMVHSTILIHIWERINPSTALTSNNDAGRSHLYALNLMLYLVKHRPVFGWGAGSMQYFSSNSSYTSLFAGGGQINTGHGSANWIGNEAVEAGVVGLFVMLVWFFSVLLRKCINQGIPFKGLYLLLFVNYLFSNGLSFGFTWTTIAMITLFQIKHHQQVVYRIIEIQKDAA